MAARTKTTKDRPSYRCTECGWQTAKWLGRCPECQAWGTVEEYGAPAVRTTAPGRVTTSALPIGQVDMKAALVALPPLVKGYLRLGGFVGDGAVIDQQFNTTDVCVVVKTDLITDKYIRHYERTAGAP